MENETPATPSSPAEPHERHGCLTAYLILMLLSNSLIGFLYLVTPRILKEASPSLPDWALLTLGLFAIFNIVCAIGLFNWKRWAFWGFCGSSIAALCVNLSIGIPPVTAIFGLAGIAIVYGLLQLGSKRTGWSQLN
jgi:hypothetical protein